MADKLNSLNFTFVARSAPSNGPSSSDAWNDSFTELATDLAIISTEWNNKIVAIIDTLPKGDLDTAVNVFQDGLDGRTMWLDSSVDSGDTDLTYFNSTNNRPVTVKEAFDDVYQYVTEQLETWAESILDSASGLTTNQKNAIGANIFDNTQTSTSSSLDGKSERNRLNNIQLAADLYGPGYVLANTGATQLTNSVFAMVDALLELHNGNWDDDIVLNHTGVVSGLTQPDITSSAPGDDTYSGSPNDLKEDLNQVRAQIKNAKGTASWLTALSSLYGGGPNSLEDLLASTSGSASKSASNPWGYSYSDVDGLETRLDAIRDFTGQTSHTDASPTYSGLNYLSNGQSLESALSTLDIGIDSVETKADSNTAHLSALLVFTGQNSATDSTPIYTSTTYVANSDNLETAIGKLDAGLTSLDVNASFSGLNDTPATYSGMQYRPLRVNEAEDEVEFDNNTTLTPSGLYHTSNITVGSGITSTTDMEVTNSGYGFVLSSPNGTRWRIQVDDSGNLTTVAI